MNKATVTKTLKKVENQPTYYSLGFKRLVSLPVRVRKVFDLSANLKTSWDSEKAHLSQKEFLEGLTVKEFSDWLKFA